MDPEDMNDPDILAAIAASLEDPQSSGNNSTNGHQPDVVDLTNDSDDDDEPVAINANSRSIVVSETEDDESEDDDDDDDDDEVADLKRAIELSLQDSRGNENDSSRPSRSNTKDNGNGGSTLVSLSNTERSVKDEGSSQSFGLLGLDRKQMEQERLARLGKRKAEDPASIDQRQTKQSRTEPIPTLDLKNVSTVTAASSASESNNPIGTTKTENQPPKQLRASGVHFPKGVVKKTHAYSCPRLGDDIMIEEVFQKSDLELAVLSSFMWDMEWLFSKLDTRNSRFILVMQAKDDATKRQYESETAAMSNLRLCFPPMDGQVNCMHSKLMLLFHPGYVRIVVPTANLTPYDWGEMGGVMENSVFIIDLPKKTDRDSTGGSETAFYEDLTYFLRATTLNEHIVSKLDKFDFSQTAHIMLVHTIGGSHKGNAWRKTGYCGLGRAVDALGLRTSKPISIDFVTSSVGSLTDEFLRSIYLAAQGDDGMTEYILRNAKSFPASNPNDPKQIIEKNTAEEWKDRFRVYFPSQTTVEQSKGGPQSAGTICFQEKWYESPKFPRQVLRDCKSQRPGLLMHNKILFTKLDNPIKLPDNSQGKAWAYVGSANLSESAWGRIVQDRATKQPKLNCRNWECGVLVPVIEEAPPVPGADNQEQEEDKDKGKEAEEIRGKREQPSHADAESADHLDVFENTIPMPMVVPGLRYRAGLKPWCF